MFYWAYIIGCLLVSKYFAGWVFGLLVGLLLQNSWVGVWWYYRAYIMGCLLVSDTGGRGAPVQ